MVFCSYSSTIPLLEEHGVPYYFLYPVKDQLESQIKELLSQIRLEKYRENLPAAIAIVAHEPSVSDKTDQILENAIQNIKKEFLIDAILQKESNVYHIYTTHRVVAMITRNFEVGYIIAMLKKKLRHLCRSWLWNREKYYRCEKACGKCPAGILEYRWKFCDERDQSAHRTARFFTASEFSAKSSG